MEETRVQLALEQFPLSFRSPRFRFVGYAGRALPLSGGVPIALLRRSASRGVRRIGLYIRVEDWSWNFSVLYRQLTVTLFLNYGSQAEECWGRIAHADWEEGRAPRPTIKIELPDPILCLLDARGVDYNSGARCPLTLLLEFKPDEPIAHSRVQPLGFLLPFYRAKTRPRDVDPRPPVAGSTVDATSQGPAPRPAPRSRGRPAARQARAALALGPTVTPATPAPASVFGASSPGSAFALPPPLKLDALPPLPELPELPEAPEVDGLLELPDPPDLEPRPLLEMCAGGCASEVVLSLLSLCADVPGDAPEMLWRAKSRVARSVPALALEGTGPAVGSSAGPLERLPGLIELGLI